MGAPAFQDLRIQAEQHSAPATSHREGSRASDGRVASVLDICGVECFTFYWVIVVSLRVVMETVLEQYDDFRFDRERKVSLTGLAVIFSLVLHAVLVLTFFWGPRLLAGVNEWLEPMGIQLPEMGGSQVLAPPPPPIMMVDLFGETERATDIPAEPIPGPEPIMAEAPDQPLLLNHLPEIPAPPPDAITLSPRAEAKPPEPERLAAAPPMVKAPEVNRIEPKKEALPKESIRQTARAEKPKNVYEMLNRTLGRDAKTLGSRSGTVVDASISSYYNRIMNKFKVNWQPIKKPAANRIMVGFVVVIEPDGRISNVHMTQSSGNLEFDRSVEKAIRNSSPLPPLPPAFAGRRDTPQFWFSPERML